MSYERNKTMVICIFAIIAVGAITVGLLASNNSWGWNFDNTTIDYHFEVDVGSTTGTVELDLDLNAAAVRITFEDNASLLYSIDIEVQNQTVTEHGAPSVTFVSGTIALNYPAGDVNVTLGSGVNYTIDVYTDAGAQTLVLTDGAHIGDITLETQAGAITVTMSDDVEIYGNVNFDFTTTTGAITLTLDLPEVIGGDFDADASIGGVTVTPVGWTQILGDHYQTDNYASATYIISITASTSVGAISATLT